jgi:hypothetical protein
MGYLSFGGIQYKVGTETKVTVGMHPCWS